MAWQLTRSLDALRDEIKQGMPNVTVYTIGDEAHRLHTSDHNPDDTSGSRAEQSDSDSSQEVRAIDIMLSVSAESMRIVQALTDPRSRARLKYVIHGGKIWSRSNGWAVRPFTSDPHNDHIHVSGAAGDDANGAGWPAVAELWENDMARTLTDDDISAVKSAILGDGGMQNMFGHVEAMASGRDPYGSGKANVLHQRVLALAAGNTAVQGKLAEIDVEVGQVDEAVLAGLGSVATPEEQADLLRAVLGDRAQEVGALLAAG